MRVITGSHEVKTGRSDNSGNPIMETVIDAVNIPDEPHKLSDFPKKAIAAVGAVREDGTVCVVTVDGKKFYVIDDSEKAKPAAAAAAKGAAKD